jgi:hypothetical protein
MNTIADSYASLLLCNAITTINLISSFIYAVVPPQVLYNIFLIIKASHRVPAYHIYTESPTVL